MTADAWAVYNKFKEYMGDGTIDLDADSFKVALFLSTSNAATLTLDGLAALTNQHANGNGYTTGGVAVTSITWVESSGTVTFDSADVSFTASAGNIVFRFAVLYDDTVTSPTADPPVCFTLPDDTPADTTIVDGNTTTLQLNANGYFQLA